MTSFGRGFTLQEIAERADLAVPTLLRGFGSKSALIDAAETELKHQMRDHRNTAAPGDVDEAVRVLYEHYEEWGDLVVSWLAAELTTPSARAALDDGRREHRRWVRTVFGPQLKRRTPANRAQLTDALVVATDVYTWKLLRRDMRLSARRAQLTARMLVDSLFATGR